MRFLALALLISALAVPLAAARNGSAVGSGPAQTPPEGHLVPAPDRITLTWLTWGQVREAWVISDGGQARWSGTGDQEKTFTAASADFSRVREALRPYEATEFSCERIVSDMPYGYIVWSSPHGSDHRIGFDAGCTGGDADDLLRRLEEARSILEAARDRT
jgi:hypothetical protein